MAAGDLITLPWQIELDGVLMGPSTDYVTRGFEPWGSPEIRHSEADRAGRHGQVSGRDWLAGRLVTADFYVTGTTDALEMSNRQALTAAWAPSADDTPVPLVWMEDDGQLYRLVGKPKGATVQMAPRMPVDCRFLATDPAIYSNTAQTASTGLSTATGGLSFAATAPFVFGTAGTGNTMACPNNGTWPTGWAATLSGPLTAPVLQHEATGHRVSLSGCTLASGETLVLDSTARTVLLNGTASRYSWLDSFSQWFDLDPGSNSVTLLGASGSGTVELTWRSAWI